MVGCTELVVATRGRTKLHKALDLLDILAMELQVVVVEQVILLEDLAILHSLA